MDMPGYGYARVSKTEREKWGRMIEDYLQNRENMCLIMQLIDSRHQPSEDDCLMYDWLVYYGLDPVIVATKCDKLSKVRQKKALDNIAKTLGLRRKEDVFLFSAADKTGREEGWTYIEDRIASAVAPRGED